MIPANNEHGSEHYQLEGGASQRRVDELGDEGQEEEGGLRIEDVDDRPLPEDAPFRHGFYSLDHDAFSGRTKRGDRQVQQIGGPGPLDRGERRRGGCDEGAEAGDRRSDVDQAPQMYSQNGDQTGPPTLGHAAGDDVDHRRAWHHEQCQTGAEKQEESRWLGHEEQARAGPTLELPGIRRLAGMKTILLMRHAKSDWDASYGSDHDRPLASRGHRSATVMGRVLSAWDEIPDLVITSSAVRAMATAEEAARAGGWNCPIVVEPDFYGSGPGSVLSAAQEKVERGAPDHACRPRADVVDAGRADHRGATRDEDSSRGRDRPTRRSLAGLGPSPGMGQVCRQPPDVLRNRVGPRLVIGEMSWPSGSWEVVAMVGGEGPAPVLAGTHLTLEIGDEGSASGFAGCNHFFGRVGDDGSLGPLGRTLMACPPDLMAQEDAYLALLERAEGISIVDDKVEIRAGEETLVFLAPIDLEIRRVTWVLTGIHDGQSGFSSVLGDVVITLLLDDEGRATGSSGCNRYTATYTLTEEGLEIGAAAGTRMLCPEPVMVQEVRYLGWLPEVATRRVSVGRSGRSLDLA